LKNNRKDLMDKNKLLKMLAFRKQFFCNFLKISACLPHKLHFEKVALVNMKLRSTHVFQKLAVQTQAFEQKTQSFENKKQRFQNACVQFTRI